MIFSKKKKITSLQRLNGDFFSITIIIIYFSNHTYIIYDIIIVRVLMTLFVKFREFKKKINDIEYFFPKKIWIGFGFRKNKNLFKPPALRNAR